MTTVILGAVLAVALSGKTSFFLNTLKLELYQKGRNALGFMEEELIQTKTSLLSVPADNNYYPTATFQVPLSIDQNSIVTWSSNITYSLVGNQIIRTQDGNAQVIASDATDLEFRVSSTNPQLLEIKLTMFKQDARTPDLLPMDFMVYIKLRN